ncbi:CRISPR-associated protein Cas2 [Aliihoeflea sp. 40Bstr573]|uniref:CRISPR-associated protein Cas2 n=1 Tax=Aliihoeflea sp. 40Bstr573 TaxID=2696467 RepID=UPI0020941457|nr:CRISPR-associated protein Cas2 [Aliihoeflea sp. 40Bstr573]
MKRARWGGSSRSPIGYDLIRRKDYPKLWEEMERLSAHKAIRDFYLANLNNTAVEVRNHLRSFVDEDDRVIVIEFSKKPQFTMALEGTNDWIAENC